MAAPRLLYVPYPAVPMPKWLTIWMLLLNFSHVLSIKYSNLYLHVLLDTYIHEKYGFSVQKMLLHCFTGLRFCSCIINYFIQACNSVPCGYKQDPLKLEINEHCRVILRTIDTPNQYAENQRIINEVSKQYILPVQYRL